DTGLGEALAEVDDAGLGGVSAAVEHRLAGEDPAGEDAVEAADQLVADPDLEAVGDAGPVQGAVGGVHGGRDPRLGPVGAAGDDVVEGRIHRRLPTTVTEPAAKGAG